MEGQTDQRQDLLISIKVISVFDKHCFLILQGMGFLEITRHVLVRLFPFLLINVLNLYRSQKLEQIRVVKLTLMTIF